MPDTRSTSVPGTVRARALPAGPGPTARLILLLLLAAVLVGLATAVLSLPPVAPGLGAVVTEHLPASGVEHPVTAVLLNFRGYDTLLELAVLWLALLAVWSLTPAPLAHEPTANPMLAALNQLLAPLMILVAGYLLWNGGHAPGGAFQAGAVLGATGVLLHLSGRRLPRAVDGWPLRLALLLGVALFSLIGLAVMAGGAPFLTYPPASAGGLILAIEAAATLSIAATLAALFLGGRP
ncbi:MAG: sodium:proton antiporter [Chromatiaceae bacterium]|nr:MAG: sodium:proton antiporter [Chromatiaceae bacterium]